MSQGITIPLEVAESLGRALLNDWRAAGLIREGEVAGSVRRRRPTVHDVDLVVIPEPKRLADFRSVVAPYWRKGAQKAWTLLAGAMPVDVYLADAQSWPTLLLIRTGSKEHNIALCQRARALGMKLHASGDGLELVRKDAGGTCWVHCETEADIFAALELPYRQPEAREVR